MISQEEREKRKQNIEFGLAINSIEGVPPGEDFKELAQEYIDGKKEIKEIIEILVKKYTVKMDI